jgi:hypothetical protein
MKLGLDNLRLLVVVTHCASPRAETPKSCGSLLGDLGIEKLLIGIVSWGEIKIWLEQLDGLLINLILLVRREIEQVL